MMYFLGGLENAVLQTLLAERIRLNLPVTDTLPRSAVGVLIIGTLVSVVEALRLCLVLWAILFSRRGEAGAAGVAAGPLGTGGHHSTSFWAKEKPPGIFLLDGCPLCYFSIIQYIRLPY